MRSETFEVGGEERTLRLEAGEGDLWHVTWREGEEPRPVEVRWLGDDRLLLTLDGRVHLLHVTTSGDQIFVAVEGERFALTPQRPEATAQSDVADDPKSDGRVTTPMPGKIIDLLVEEGERVEAGAPVAILEAMKMESEVLASCGGTVTKIHVAKGDQVPFGQLLLEITP